MHKPWPTRQWTRRDKPDPGEPARLLYFPEVQKKGKTVSMAVLASGVGVGSSTERAMSALGQAAAGPCVLVGLLVTGCFVFRLFI